MNGSPFEACVPSLAAAALASLGHDRRIARGDPIIFEGLANGVCVSVVSGVLRSSKATEDGREAIVGLQFAGDFVGRPFAARAAFSLSAATDAELRCYPRPAFEALLRDQPAIEHELYRRALDEIDNMHGWMLVLGRQVAGEKVGSFLLHLARRFGGGDRFDLPLTRAEIGDVLGLTIGTVSRELAALRRIGLIATPGQRGLVIRDQRALAARTGLASAFVSEDPLCAIAKTPRGD